MRYLGGSKGVNAILDFVLEFLEPKRRPKWKNVLGRGLSIAANSECNFNLRWLKYWWNTASLEHELEILSNVIHAEKCIYLVVLGTMQTFALFTSSKYFFPVAEPLTSETLWTTTLAKNPMILKVKVDVILEWDIWFLWSRITLKPPQWCVIAVIQSNWVNHTLYKG